jgi:hypothetical protein
MATDPLQPTTNLANQITATQSTPIDMSSVINKNTAAALQATKVPDTTAQMNTAKQFAAGLNADVKPVGQAMVSDLQAKITGAEQAQKLNEASTNIRKDALQASLMQSRENLLQAKKNEDAFLKQTGADLEYRDKVVAEMGAQGQKVQSDYLAQINKWAATNDKALIGDIETANYAMHQNSSAMERQIKESDPNWENSPRWENFRIEQGMAFKASANQLISQARQKTQDMLQAGASGAAAIAGGIVQNASWAAKYALDFQQAATSMVQQVKAQTLAYTDTLRAMDLSNMNEYADFLRLNTIPVPELAPMMATILDLQQASEAQRKADEADAKAEALARQSQNPTHTIPTAGRSGNLTSVPASWSQGAATQSRANITQRRGESLASAQSRSR